MSIESITGLLEDFDPAALLPELDTVIGRVEFFTRLAVMAGPLVLLVLGVLYFFAGIVFAALGLILTVVMLIVCAGFRGQPMPDMIGSGITALIWQIVLAALAVVGINVTIAVLFDRQGERRKKAESQPENDTNV